VNLAVLRISAPEGEPRFRFIDALRTLSLVWITLFHVIFYASFFLSRDKADALFGAWQARSILRGHFALDVLFVITGFLIGYYVLVDADRNRFAFLPWIVKRMARLVPAYVVALLIFHFIPRLDWNFSYVWANLLFVNNYLPLMHQTMSWSWSLPVDVHFYFLFPVLLWLVRDRSKRLFNALCYIFLALLVVRGYVDLTSHLTLPMQIDPRFEVARFEHYFDTMYDKSHTRIGAIVCGLMVAALIRYHGAAEWLSARPLVASLLAVAALVMGLVILAAPVLPGEAASYDPTWGAIYLIVYNYAFALSVAYLLLLLLTENALAAPVRWLLSRSWWFVPAELCYGVFLLNPMVVLGLFALYTYAFGGLSFSAPAFMLYGVAAVTVTFALAYVLYVTVERPFRSRGKRLASRLQRRATRRAEPAANPAG
jgi:peptidoglycan/LPS O-acetylase OafA/YrhL